MDLSDMKYMCYKRGLNAFRSIDGDGVVVGKGVIFYGFFSKTMDQEEFEMVLEGFVLDSLFE